MYRERDGAAGGDVGASLGWRTPVFPMACIPAPVWKSNPRGYFRLLSERSPEFQYKKRLIGNNIMFQI